MLTLSLYHKAHGDARHFHTILTRMPGSRGESAAAQCSGEAWVLKVNGGKGLLGFLDLKPL